MALEREVFNRTEVKVAVEAMFVPVRINANESPGIAAHYNVQRLPADVVVAPNGQVLAQLKCPPGAVQYLAQLEFVARGRPAGPASGNQPAVNQFAGNTGNAAPINQHVHPASATAPALGGGAEASVNGRGAWSGTPTDRIANYSWRESDYGSQPPPAVASYAVDPQQQHQWSQKPAGGVAETNAMQVTYGPVIQSAASAVEQKPIAQPAIQPPASSGYGANVGPSNSSASVPALVMVPASQAPPVGLDGYCPVQLQKLRNKWTKGDPRYGVVHRGRTYLFRGPAEQQEFLADPDRFSPVLCGFDPVLAVELGQHVPGTRSLGRFCGDRVYLFATPQSLAKFEAEAEEARVARRANKYSDAAYLAENPSRGALR
jgi:protein disulfide-isomerase